VFKWSVNWITEVFHRSSFIFHCPCTCVLRLKLGPQKRWIFREITKQVQVIPKWVIFFARMYEFRIKKGFSLKFYRVPRSANHRIQRPRNWSKFRLQVCLTRNAKIHFRTHTIPLTVILYLILQGGCFLQVIFCELFRIWAGPRLEIQKFTAQRTQVHLRLSWGSVHGSNCSNIELGGLLTWALL